MVLEVGLSRLLTDCYGLGIAGVPRRPVADRDLLLRRIVGRPRFRRFRIRGNAAKTYGGRDEKAGAENRSERFVRIFHIKLEYQFGRE